MRTARLLLALALISGSAVNAQIRNNGEGNDPLARCVALPGMLNPAPNSDTTSVHAPFPGSVSSYGLFPHGIRSVQALSMPQPSSACSSQSYPTQLQAAGFTRLCEEHRLLGVVGGGLLAGALALAFVKGLESAFGTTSEESDLEIFGISALVGSGVTWIACGVATGTLWYRMPIDGAGDVARGNAERRPR
jgi:hypothetical protein